MSSTSLIASKSMTIMEPEPGTFRYPPDRLFSLKPAHHSRSWIWAYYLAVIVVGFSRPFMFDQRAEIIGNFAVALPPAYWLLSDAKTQRFFVPHVIQPAIVGFWFIVIPAYLVGTRKWRGLVYLVVHAAISFLATIATYHLSVEFVWPIVFRSGG